MNPAPETSAKRATASAAETRERPLLWSLLALFAGLTLVGVLSLWLDPSPPWVTEVPLWLANRLAQLLAAPGSSGPGGLGAADREFAIAAPDLLWMVPIALLPWLFVSVRFSLVDLPRLQIAAQLVLRVALLCVIAFALSQPSLRAEIRGVTTVVVVDVSASIDDAALAQAKSWIVEAAAAANGERFAALDEADRPRLRVVVYDGRAKISELKVDDAQGLELRPAGREKLGALASDHAAGLRLARALLDADTEGRVVLLTDASGSAAERDSLRREAAALTASGGKLYTRFLTSTHAGDIVITGVYLPDELRVGDTFEVRVDVLATGQASLGQTATRVFLDQGETANGLMPWADVTLKEAATQLKFPARVTDAGAVVFTARLDSENLSAAVNGSTANDSAAVVGDAKGRPRVIMVGSDATQALARALRADNLTVDLIAASELPTSVEELMTTDLIIFNDAPARSVSGAAQSAIVDWVRNQGGGFVMVGGEDSFGVGGWKGTLLAGILPVEFEGEKQREEPTLALALVIDKSGSMSSEDRLALVKEAARATARTLDPGDEIAVIAFDSKPSVLVRLQKASARFRISSDIRRLSAGGGTNAVPALREAYLQLAGSKALVKHVILLSDGQSPDTGLSGLLSDMREGEITVSAVGVGAGAGKDFLARVAERGRGRYYFSQDGTDVPRIFSRETKEALKNALVERELFARVTKSVQALRGIDFDRAPGLRGIVPVTAKPQTETLLKTQHGDTLLVRGRRGLGKTLAFASDAKPRWAAAWITWSGFAKLWSQLARDTMRQGKGSLGGASVQIESDDGIGRYRVIVDVEAAEGFANELEGTITLVDPRLSEDDPGRERQVQLSLSAPGRYEAQVDGIEAGQRLVRARLYDDSDGSPRLAAEATSNISVPYPSELDPLARIGDELGLRSLQSGDALDSAQADLGEIVSAPSQVKGRTRVRPIWQWILAFGVIPLLVLDLLLRRVVLGTRQTSL